MLNHAGSPLVVYTTTIVTKRVVSDTVYRDDGDNATPVSGPDEETANFIAAMNALDSDSDVSTSILSPASPDPPVNPPFAQDPNPNSEESRRRRRAVIDSFFPPEKRSKPSPPDSATPAARTDIAKAGAVGGGNSVAKAQNVANSARSASARHTATKPANLKLATTAVLPASSVSSGPTAGATTAVISAATASGSNATTIAGPSAAAATTGHHPLSHLAAPSRTWDGRIRTNVPSRAYLRAREEWEARRAAEADALGPRPRALVYVSDSSEGDDADVHMQG